MYIKEKIINGRKYYYLSKSIRLPNGKVKVMQKLLKNRSYNRNEEEKFFIEKEKKLIKDYSLKKYKLDHILTEKEIENIEEVKVGYKYIVRKLSKNNLKDIFNRFTANFTYESNALEGNSLTLKDVAMVMFENVTIKNKDLREIYETRNSRKVVELILKKRFDINHENIIKMHKILVKDMDINMGYKKIPNEIVGSKIKTTPPEKVYGEMTDLINFYNRNKEVIHPLKLSALIHGKFEQIHPFEDGNGRVGRFIINVILVNNNYPPLIIRKSQRVAYLETLEKFDTNYKYSLERFLIKRFKETYRKFFEVYFRYI